jgi:hypothetical protein
VILNRGKTASRRVGVGVVIFVPHSLLTVERMDFIDHWLAARSMSEARHSLLHTRRALARAIFIFKASSIGLKVPHRGPALWRVEIRPDRRSEIPNIVPPKGIAVRGDGRGRVCGSAGFFGTFDLLFFGSFSKYLFYHRRSANLTREGFNIAAHFSL